MLRCLNPSAPADANNTNDQDKLIVELVSVQDSFHAGFFGGRLEPQVFFHLLSEQRRCSMTMPFGKKAAFAAQQC
jgi:hypothetical protein